MLRFFIAELFYCIKTCNCMKNIHKNCLLYKKWGKKTVVALLKCLRKKLLAETGGQDWHFLSLSIDSECEQPPQPWQVHSAAEYCAPLRCRSAHTCLIHPANNDALRIVTGCLRPTPADNLPILAGIQPVELRRNEATLSLARRAKFSHLKLIYLFCICIRKF